MKDEFLSKIQISPVIAAVNNIEKLEEAIESPCEIIFLLTGDIFNLEQIVKKVKENEKSIYVHIDLLDGFSRNLTTLRYINQKTNLDGIITTKSSFIRPAKDMGLFTIQRLFMIDSLSLDSGIESIKVTKPDAVEILPGIMPKITEKIYHETSIPIITGGLIMDKEDVIQNLKYGAVGISTSKKEIWYV
ncbi:glycerol-3-phosphate responsive antiterminator [Clostridium malenominatum]|uniref:Glycerol-3-phosphate responsive antiterminator n=1 Tax=Clostridium malenominatum TaxID=1539 RepID=A0ABP3TSI4_9CLOT